MISKEKNGNATFLVHAMIKREKSGTAGLITKTQHSKTARTDLGSANKVA